MNIESNAIPPWQSGPYSIKRHGVTISNCDSEPVQTPGCIQSRGVMAVVRYEDLTIVQVSENVVDHFALRPESVLDKPVASLIGVEGENALLGFTRRESIERNPLYFITLPVMDSGSYDLLVHRQGDLLIVEFEPAADAAEAFPDYYGMVKTSVSRLQNAQTVGEFCGIVAEEVRRLTGIDRAMVYHFHPDFHGEVVAESKRKDLSPWLGLHYPAEDIPKPARDIFKKIWVRPLPDAASPVVEMVPLTNPDTGKPLDMTHCALRGASVMYTEYLANMGVAASLTMSLMVDGELWGLIACQHETPKVFPHQMRAACEFLAQVTSLQLRSVEQRESFEYRLRIEEIQNRVITNASQESSLVPLTDSTPNLLDPMDAAGVAVFHGGRWWRLGSTPAETELDGLKDWLGERPEFSSSARPVYATDSLVRDYPPAESFADVGSGLLAIPLSRQKNAYVLWFRPETIQTVNWGGNPHDKPVVTGPHGPRLTPRRSFEIFTESVKNRSANWKRVEIDSALRFRMLIMELVVSRAEQISELNESLMRTNEELDAFAYVASHDLKEPLRGISKYAHQLMESGQMEETERRAKLESVQRLAVRMDSLLDALLHFSRVGRSTIAVYGVDLNEVLDEALEMVSARRQEIPTEVKVPRALPTIPCDRMRIREIFVNLLSNAMKYNDKPRREIEIGFSEMEDGITAFHVADNGIGIEPRHHAVVFKIFKRLHGTDAFGGGSGAGLAIVHRLVSQHRGNVWVESTPGSGTKFSFTLSDVPFP
ncbi:GAF domain-containing protein [Luteolibacter yonseiensis]|uniref:histidine kinase n=1 Tax=Luteolibacter yonseiensis TaxID=1144680 RepID=A0A934R6U5_9BACT|nr:ATP-binding protein [Luteolibacter yonseiensis]MBK1818381.1 GAF domain-containing protein [Luteolibacter yonseiensis]